MAAAVRAEERSGGAAVESFASGGMALLPRTRQMLSGLWEQLRLLVQVIYYTFLSVFQMFRFEVHVRITDETGQHIQHMTTASNPTESFLFSSLFDGDNGVMVGGSNPLSNFRADVGESFAGKSTAEALLSTLRADDLCCGLVDDFVSGKEDGIFLGHQSSWKMGFPGDWNIFVSSSDSSNDGCRKSGETAVSEEERSFHWSSEEDQNVAESDSEESKALWESLSRCSDPYNPLFFSACISTNTNMGRSKDEAPHSEADLEPASKASEEALNVWVSRSDSESSWNSSDSSGPDMDEESEKLLELFSSSKDPYNPMCFTASTFSSTSAHTCTPDGEEEEEEQQEEEEEQQEGSSPSSEDDEEDQLWKSLCPKDDPYHPLNFRACLQSSPAAPEVRHTQRAASALQRGAAAKPSLPHLHPERRLVHWRRPGGPAEDRRDGSVQKRVRFSPEVKVHVMWTWPFARRACRKGPWEEMARDRDRFRRRVQETEQAIGYCLSPAHREKMRRFLDGALKTESAL